MGANAVDRRASWTSANGSAYARPAQDDWLVDTSCRALDVIGAAFLLIVLSPLLLALAVAVRLDSPGPVLFRQRRLGRHTEPFMVNKFRTMHHGVAHDHHREFVVGLITGAHPGQGGEQNGDPRHGVELAQSPGHDGEHLRHDNDPPRSERAPLYKMVGDKRMTRFGKVLRRTSLDELPQLWNVLRGEMSLVGPRPPIPYEVEHYPSHWFARFAVKPGITGLWQVNGRSEVPLEEMVRLDVEYAQRRSLGLNLSIIARTVPAVLSGRGAW